MLGHELRRPLTVIRGAATLLVDDLDALPPASRQQMLGLIDRSAAAMAELIDDVLTAVHLERGDIEYLLEPVDLAGMLAEALEAARRVDPERPIDVTAPDGMVLEADREYAMRAVRAALVNAVQHTPSGSRVEVVVKVDESADAVRLEVLDRGPGIPAPRREQAFARFSRLDERAGGAGLGLYLARGLARGMGGDVTLRDREDGGTAVCFTLRRRA